MSDPERVRPPTAEELKYRAGLIQMLDGEVDRQLESVGARSQSMATRASILIGAASILTGLQVSGDARPWQYSASLTASALAAIIGVFALLPRIGTEVPLASVESTFWNYSESQALWTLYHWKFNTLKDQERALKWRALLIVAGFTFLALAIVLAALALTDSPNSPTNGDDNGRQPAATCTTTRAAATADPNTDHPGEPSSVGAATAASTDEVGVAGGYEPCQTR